ncbi:YMGG-like glycine zipper-containing protein [Telmatospirillum sp. J64-1]|uniref:YMGG-like glycine zipper-containing protein n=1 Tax=Telmatospirillum sp. J64-1 TaxID=2502183 RepID=UPI00115DD86D|nr:YMGG-like glycine zipper-containing protein [Telmatospirillum sp. J64-1]
MPRLPAVALVMLAGLGLAACGNTTQDRALSGAGIGAATGGALGAVTGNNVGTGALLGGAAGAAAGGLTTRDQIDLGDPVWR